MSPQLVAGIKSLLRPIVRHRFLIERAKFIGTPILGQQAGNDRIAELIRAARPVAIGKMGASELGGLRRYERLKDASGHCADWGREGHRLHVNAGVFPDDPRAFDRFCQQFASALGDLDLLAVWFQFGERALQRRFAPAAALTDLLSLEPFLNDRPWSAELAEKRVVVVTPFTATVESQYARRAQVWQARPEMLPAFELRTVRCPLSAALAGPVHADWFAALNAMTAEMDAQPYDVAIVGAGAWGLPLVSHAKRTGHVGVHLGGPTQILFGVRGSRWDAHPILSRYFNDAWVRPGDADRPAAYRQIENGCYW